MGLDIHNILNEQDAGAMALLAEYDEALVAIVDALIKEPGTYDSDTAIGQDVKKVIDGLNDGDIGNEDMYGVNAITERINLAVKVVTTATAAPAKAIQTVVDKYNQNG